MGQGAHYVGQLSQLLYNKKKNKKEAISQINLSTTNPSEVSVESVTDRASQYVLPGVFLISLH